MAAIMSKERKQRKEWKTLQREREREREKQSEREWRKRKGKFGIRGRERERWEREGECERECDTWGVVIDWVVWGSTTYGNTNNNNKNKHQHQHIYTHTLSLSLSIFAAMSECNPVLWPRRIRICMLLSLKTFSL